MFALVAGCATGPELHDDFATYEVSSEPIPLTPIPGADITTWTEAIEGLEVGEWLNSGGPITDAYFPARAEPQEDPRVEADRLSWELEGVFPLEDVELTFSAHAMTDTSENMLSIYCEAAYGNYEYSASEWDIPFDEVRRVLQGCIAGSGNNAIGSEELSAWLDEQMDFAEAEYAATPQGRRFMGFADFVDAGNVLVWFSSSDRETTVSLSVDLRTEAGLS
ncbi:hypothetical protein O1R50_23850 [Glycomyces luteolus]|uniref:Uncharacterized protein n=1 Tax=Glycomyces luteolus TaxID=2670330 RepID=A0A9X3PCP4_9ACTN|nr:hypothetical protein [Glycomyces luteolus]MDA1362677.1 hypothetical protein [Glycomyces luteolus]